MVQVQGSAAQVSQGMLMPESRESRGLVAVLAVWLVVVYAVLLVVVWSG